MGKKGTKRKTRWRALPLGEEDGGSGNEEELLDEDKSTTSSIIGQPFGERTNPAVFRMGERPYRQSKRYPYERDRFRNKEPLIKLENKTFDEEEYTKITTPRQDVLFKKGYFGRRRESSIEESIHYAGEVDGDEQTMDQIIITNGFVDERGHYLVNGNSYEIYDPYTNTVTVVVGPPPYTSGVTQPVLAAVSCQPVPLQPVDWYPPGNDWPTQGSSWAPSFHHKPQPDSLSSPNQSFDSTSVQGSEVQTPNLYQQPAYMMPGYFFEPPAYANDVPASYVTEVPKDDALDKKLKKTRRKIIKLENGEEQEIEEEIDDEEPQTPPQPQPQLELENQAATKEEPKIHNSEIIAPSGPAVFVVESRKEIQQERLAVAGNPGNDDSKDEQGKAIEKQSHSTQTNVPKPNMESKEKESHSTQTSPLETDKERQKTASDILLSSLSKNEPPSPTSNKAKTSPVKRPYQKRTSFKPVVEIKEEKKPEISPLRTSYAKTVMNGLENTSNANTNTNNVNISTNVNVNLNEKEKEVKLMNGVNRVKNGMNGKFVNSRLGEVQNGKKVTNGTEEKKITNGTDEVKRIPNGFDNEKHLANGGERVPNRKTHNGIEEVRKVSNGVENVQKITNGVEESGMKKSTEENVKRISNGLENVKVISNGIEKTNDEVNKKVTNGFSNKPKGTPNEMKKNVKAKTAVKEQKDTKPKKVSLKPLVKPPEEKEKCESRSNSEKSSSVSELSSPTELSSGQNTPPEKLIVRKMEQKIANEINKSFEEKLKNNLDEIKTDEKVKQKKKKASKSAKKLFKKKASVEDIDLSFLDQTPEDILANCWPKTEDNNLFDSILTTTDEDILKTLGVNKDDEVPGLMTLNPNLLKMLPSFRPDRPKFKLDDLFASTSSKRLHSDIFTKTNITNMKSTKPEEFFASIVDSTPNEIITNLNNNNNTININNNKKKDKKAAKEEPEKKSKTGYNKKTKDEKEEKRKQDEAIVAEIKTREDTNDAKKNSEEEDERKGDVKFAIVEAVNTWLQEQTDLDNLLSVDSLPQSLDTLEEEFEPDQKNGISNPLHALSANGTVGANGCTRVANEKKAINPNRKIKKFLSQSANYCQDLIGDVKNGILPDDLCDPKQSVLKYYTIAPVVINEDSDSEVFEALDYLNKGNLSITDSGVHSDTESTDETATNMAVNENQPFPTKEVCCKVQ